MKRALILCSLLAGGASVADDWPHAVDSQKAGEHPPGPAEQVAKMTVPEGFKVTLFAGEPDVRQPVAMTFDDRGRMWVLECYTYTGKKEFDTEKRDRIVIFEDKDGDGRFDSRKVFWDEGVRAFGLEWGHGGVWVLQAPYLTFIPDYDGDDVPDGPIQHHLDGFTVEASHNNVNGLRWGPDGWLWGRHGMLKPSKAAVVGTPDDEREEFQACIWRYHVVEKKFELVCTGGINPWGFDWNEVGEMFFTNNVNGHLFHLLPGARYRTKFVPPRDSDRQPFLAMCADHQHWEHGKNWNQARDGTGTTDELGGGHSHCGGMIYLGDNWPKEYRGRVFLHNTHGKRINQEILERKGSGYVAKHGQDFLMANSEWYRGVELKYGPDGGVFALDWSDYGECHDHDGVHRGSGRIYKITHGDPGEHTSFDLGEFTDLELVELQLFKNDWWVRQARRILQERSIASTLDRGEVERELMRIYRHPDVTRRLRALWCLHATGLVDQDWLHVQLRDENEHIRVWALRLMADNGIGYGVVRLIFGRLARNDPSPLVRVHLASVLQTIPIGYRIEVAKPIALHAEDAGDPNLPLMLWFAIEESITRTPDLAIELAAGTPHRLLRRLVARKVAASYDKIPDSLGDLIEVLGAAESRELQRDLLDGLLDALWGGRRIEMPEAFGTVFAALSESPDRELAAKAAQLAVVFADREALETMKRKAADPDADPKARRQALAVLSESGEGGLEALFAKALEDPELVIPAMRGLAAHPAPDSAALILARFGKMGPAEARVAISILSSRREFAAVLLGAIEAGTVPSGALTAFDARQIERLGDKDLTAHLRQLWGSVRATSAERKQEIETYRSLLAGTAAGESDRGRGRVIFAQRCAACHTLWGEGGQAGPDLTGSDRRNLDYLLLNILDPSASVAQDYVLTTIELKNGQFLGGFVDEEVGSTIRLRSQDQLHTVNRDEIVKRSSSKISLMPEGLLKGLAEAEVRDLFAYLRGEQQARGPEAP